MRRNVFLENGPTIFPIPSVLWDAARQSVHSGVLVHGIVGGQRCNAWKAKSFRQRIEYPAFGACPCVGLATSVARVRDIAC